VSRALERLASIGLTVAALIIAITFAYREFLATPSGPPEPDAGPPSYVPNWRQMLSAGVLLGDSSAPVKIVEFGDFECPYCRQAEFGLRAVRKKYPSGVATVFVHFPLAMHRFALPAARAAECAAAQGHFDRMHDLIFDKQDSLGLKSWGSYAYEAGIRDTITFNPCDASRQDISRVDSGLAVGRRFGVNATPTILVNGWRFAVPPMTAELDSAVVSILSQVRRPASK